MTSAGEQGRDDRGDHECVCIGSVIMPACGPLTRPPA